MLAASELAAASNTEYALFAGGALPVTAYDKALTRSTPVALSEAKIHPVAARAGNYILVAGGDVNYSQSDKVDAYDIFLTRTSAEPLSVPRSSFAGTTLRDYAVFGGWSIESSNRGAVDVYDAFLTRTVPSPLAARSDLAAAAVGDFALFGGGYDSVSIAIQ